MYVQYERALALDGAGRSSEAKALFRRIAQYNVNGPSVAVSRADATLSRPTQSSYVVASCR